MTEEKNNSSLDQNHIAGENEAQPVKRRINPLLLLGEPESNTKDVRATGATGVRRPAQEQLVEAEDFNLKKLPSLPALKNEEISTEATVSTDAIVSSDTTSLGIQPLPSLPKPIPAQGDGSKIAVRGINPLLLPGGGNPQGGKRMDHPPVITPPPVVTLPAVVSPLVVDSELQEEDIIPDTITEKDEKILSTIGDSFEEEDEEDQVSESTTFVPSNFNSDMSDEEGVENEDNDSEASAVSPRRINPLFLAGEEKELAEINPHLHGQRRLRANNVILLPTDVDTPQLPKRDTSSLFNPREAVKKKPSQYIRRLDAHVDADDWTEDNYDTDTSLGLGGEAEDESTSRKTQYNKGFHLTERDIIIIRFLARYRYAYATQLARLVDTTPRNMSARLRVLEKRGILRKENITDRQYLWTSRKGGNVLADINFSEIRKGQISYITLPHTLAVVNIGVELEREAGGKDLLGEGKNQESEWQPPMDRWKFGIWGNPDGKTLGYMTVTEREIRQGQLRTRGNRDAKEMREMVELVAKNSEPVELEEGQEGLFVVYGQPSQGGEHIPDLTVVRPRDEITGRPMHIAIEMELTAKQPVEWKKILRNFRDNGSMYDKIMYFTHRRSIATAIQKADEEVGLGDRLVIRKYVPTKDSSIPFWG